MYLNIDFQKPAFVMERMNPVIRLWAKMRKINNEKDQPHFNIYRKPWNPFQGFQRHSASQE